MKSAVTVSLVSEARGGPFVFWEDLPAACRKAADLGFDAVEIFAPGPDSLDPEQLRKLLADHHLQLAAVGTGGGWVKHRLHLTLPDESKRRAARDFIRSMIDFAGPLGAPAILGSMQGRHGDGVSCETALAYLTEALEELGAHAEQYDVPLLFEPLNRYESNLINRVVEGAAFLDCLTETSNVKLLCDLFHMNIEEDDVADSLREVGTQIGHIHFVDSNRKAAGLGHTDFRPIFAALHEVDYHGYLSVEAFPIPDPKTAATQTIRAFRYWCRQT